MSPKAFKELNANNAQFLRPESEQKYINEIKEKVAANGNKPLSRKEVDRTFEKYANLSLHNIPKIQKSATSISKSDVEEIYGDYNTDGKSIDLPDAEDMKSILDNAAKQANIDSTERDIFDEKYIAVFKKEWNKMNKSNAESIERDKKKFWQEADESED